MATAHAAREVGLPCTIFVPESTPQPILTKLQQYVSVQVLTGCAYNAVSSPTHVPARTPVRYGAGVVVHGAAWDEANERAVAEAAATGGTLVHPFDQPEVWNGNATLVYELVRPLCPVAPGDSWSGCPACGILGAAATGQTTPYSRRAISGPSEISPICLLCRWVPFLKVLCSARAC